MSPGSATADAVCILDVLPGNVVEIPAHSLIGMSGRQDKDRSTTDKRTNCVCLRLPFGAPSRNEGTRLPRAGGLVARRNVLDFPAGG